VPESEPRVQGLVLGVLSSERAKSERRVLSFTRIVILLLHVVKYRPVRAEAVVACLSPATATVT